MTAYGELPAQTESSLSTEEVIQFRDTVVFEGVRWLKRGFDFVNIASVGSCFEIEETIVSAANKFTVSAAVEIFSLIDEDDSLTRAAQVCVTTEFMSPDITDNLIDMAKAAGESIDADDEDQAVYTAWQRTEYIFDTTDDPFEISTYFVLKDALGNVIWSDVDMGEDEGSLSELEVARLEGLQDLLEGEMTTEHCEYVWFALKSLGVPEEVLGIDS